MPHDNRRYLWLDFETTGDNPSADSILEVGWFVTDHKLNCVHAGASCLVLPHERWESMMIPVVKEMHDRNGLRTDILGAISGSNGQCLLHPSRVEELIARDLEKVSEAWLPPDDLEQPQQLEFVLAGSGISQLDMPFIKRKMPRLASMLSYFMLDIGQVRRFLRDVAGVELDPLEEAEYQQQFRAGAHRAYDDAVAHWQEARWWAAKIERLTHPLGFFIPATQGENVMPPPLTLPDAIEQPDKYSVFKTAEFERILTELLPVLSAEFVERIEAAKLTDATVIRGQDVFAGPALHVYASSAALAASLVEFDSGAQKRLQQIADLFHTRAVAADENPHKKLPD